MLLAAAVASVTAWSYMQRVLLPWENHVNVKPGKLKAEMGDLYPRWVGTRELLTESEKSLRKGSHHRNSDGVLWTSD